MKWVLVYIIISNGEPLSVNANGPRHTFDTMFDCFYAREAKSQQVGGKDGHFPVGSQAVCVPVGPNT